MKPRFYFFAAALLCCLIKVSPVFSQEPIFNRVSPPEGAWGVITGITQDPQGYLWFGSAGLYKYDGYHVTHYQHDPLNPNHLSVTVSNAFMRIERESFGLALFQV